MATRGTIALEFADGSVGAVYCHYDNYLSGTGITLQNHYTDPFKVQQLIDGGDLSSLGPVIGVKRPFDNPHSYSTPEYAAFQEAWGNQCLFYGRDRGENGVDARYYQNWEHYARTHRGEEFDYVLRRNGSWLVRSWDTDGEWVDLAEAIRAEAQAELHE